MFRILEHINKVIQELVLASSARVPILKHFKTQGQVVPNQGRMTQGM